ncbi:MAG: IS66 family insertion sequence element accessory protein TnpB [Treponema sp.]|jgi:transposase|nr:IS66 family insertion sequence element accessory protein TnpB [Treponema sp.]
MTIDLSKARIFIRPGYTDLRKAVNGLSVMVEQQMSGEPFSGNVYLFCNRERRLLKAVWWDRNGFWLSQKRLEKDKFPWPGTEEEARELSVEELSLLLKGIDFFAAHKRLYYKKVS